MSNMPLENTLWMCTLQNAVMKMLLTGEAGGAPYSDGKAASCPGCAASGPRGTPSPLPGATHMAPAPCFTLGDKDILNCPLTQVRRHRWHGRGYSASFRITSSSGLCKVDTTLASPRCVPALLQDLMADPVLCADGMTYERAAILQWLKTHDTSPMTGAKLACKVLVPNLVLRHAVAALQ